MVATSIKKIMYNMNCATGMFPREIIYMVWVGQVSGLVENFTMGIFLDTIDVING